MKTWWEKRVFIVFFPKLLLLSDASSFFASTASGYITLVCDKFNDSTANWFKIDQSGKKSGGNILVWFRDVGEYHPLLSSARLIDTRRYDIQ